MKTKPVALILLAFAVTLASGAGLLAIEKGAARTSGRKGAAPAGKPVLKVDASALGDAGSPVVLSYADSLEKIRPAVVSVYSSKIVRQQIPEFLRQYGLKGSEQKQRGLGSGVIISTDGYIITNNHVVEEADELKVLLNDDREFTAKLIGTDPKTDVAVIKIDVDNLPAATLADSSKLRVGDVVFAIGNPLGVGQTVTMGIVSATNRRVRILEEIEGYEDFIQTDAAINQGNSGGALIDARGRLIGINSAIISTSQGNIGIGFAIPINLASSIMHSLIETGTVSRGYLGVSTDTVNADIAEAFGLKADTRGVIITDLSPPDGPAAKGGLRRDDIIVAINGEAVSSRDDLRLIIAQTPPATKISVKFIREGKEGVTDVVLGKKEDDNASEGELFTGVDVAPMTKELRRDLRIDERIDGLVIIEVAENSPYREVLPQGSVIEQINRVPVTDLASAKRALRDGRNVIFYYYRGVRRFVTVTSGR